jgi:hypothetical protein
VFLFILGFETIISTVLFVAGVNYVLTLDSAASIVQGILGISFITDIDNKVYEITLIPEDDAANVEVCKFRTTGLDVLDTILNREQETKLSLKRNKDEGDSSSHHSGGVSDPWSVFTNFMQWPILIALVLSLVLGMRTTYCDE